MAISKAKFTTKTLAAKASVSSKESTNKTAPQAARPSMRAMTPTGMQARGAR